MPRDAYDTAAVRHTSAWALVFEGKHAGNVVVGFSREGHATATASVWAGPLYTDRPGWTHQHGHGHASGGGYCKKGSAIGEALARIAGEHPAFAAFVQAARGAGYERARSTLEEIGYTVCVVC